MADTKIALRSLVEKMIILTQNKNPNLDDLKEMNELSVEQDKLMCKLDQPSIQEVLLDLQITYRTSAHVGRFIRNLQASTTKFNPSQFAEKFVSHLTQHGVIDWDKLAKMAIPLINRAPGVTPMLGTFKPSTQQVVMPERKKRSSHVKEKTAEKQEPEKIENIEKNDDSVHAKVNYVVRALRKCYEKTGKTPIDFYKFILHPTSFTQTVENLYYISFIIRDGLAVLDIMDDTLTISPMEPQRNVDNKKIVKYQMIFNISMSDWEELVLVKEIEAPLINWTR